MGRPMRTRFAPSPTGELHIGNARTALFNWLFAKHSGGKFIIRIEDTDIARSQAIFEDSILRDLRWLGLLWDEGPDKDGSHGPYRQSERLDIYRQYAGKLLNEGLAYNCYCTMERLEELKRAQVSAGLPPRYDGRCRNLNGSEIPQGITPVIRFKVPERVVSFKDAVHGEVSFDTKAFGDFVLIGSDGVASYNFAVVADDALMEVTHIIRGDDHLSNTPRQILLYKSLGLELPNYCHIPLVLGSNRTPLSKRDSAGSLRSLREQGFLPEAVINTIARLGWNPGEGLLSLDELAKDFSFDKLSKAPSIFDIERLKYYNKISIERAEGSRIAELISAPSGTDKEFLIKAVSLVKANAMTLRDIEELLATFIGEIKYSEDAKSALDEPHSKGVIKAFRIELEKAFEINEGTYKEAVSSVQKQTNEKGKRLYFPIRAALTGEVHGIELVNILKLLGKEKAIERLKKAEE
ncbi:MAG: glutamate--tRNA ligase [Deltaproteobacteria bacterium]|nr:glutamate--tRNA ligase [Deltaproteobacteria bacterium]